MGDTASDFDTGSSGPSDVQLASSKAAPSNAVNIRPVRSTHRTGRRPAISPLGSEAEFMTKYCRVNMTRNPNTRIVADFRHHARRGAAAEQCLRDAWSVSLPETVILKRVAPRSARRPPSSLRSSPGVLPCARPRRAQPEPARGVHAPGVNPNPRYRRRRCSAFPQPENCRSLRIPPLGRHWEYTAAGRANPHKTADRHRRRPDYASDGSMKWARSLSLRPCASMAETDLIANSRKLRSFSGTNRRLT